MTERCGAMNRGLQMVKTDAFADCTVVAATSRRSGVSTYLSNVLAGIRDGGEMHARYRALVQLSDADLAKRGLTREGLARAILDGSV
jgi:hypothetical protein